MLQSRTEPQAGRLCFLGAKNAPGPNNDGRAGALNEPVQVLYMSYFSSICRAHSRRCEYIAVNSRTCFSPM